MEPLIKLRLLSSQLEQNELRIFVQKIVDTHGFEKIISFIFNHFLLKYHQNKQHSQELSDMVGLISDIISARKKNNAREDTQNKESKNDKIPPLKIDTLPPELIAECSSYLPTKDYAIFGQSNRTIYCATNAPNLLQKLDITFIRNYNLLDLNRFAMVQTLCLFLPKFTKYLSSEYPNNNHFLHLNKLDLYAAQQKNTTTNHKCTQKFIDSKPFNFAQITHLTLDFFGNSSKAYDFDGFCDLLTQFPNVTHLELYEIHLTEFNSENDTIANITPNLRVLDCYCLGSNNASNLLRNHLVHKYAKQISELQFDAQYFDIDTYSLTNLQRLFGRNITDTSLKTILESTVDLTNLFLKKYPISETAKNAIIRAVKQSPNMEWLGFNVKSDAIQNVVSYIEKALINSKSIPQKSLKITLYLDENDSNNTHIGMDDIELYIVRIMNVLDTSNISDVMLRFTFAKDLDKNEYRDTIIGRFQSAHLAVLLERGECDGDDSSFTIIISNKNCKINGYSNKTSIS